MRDYAGISGRRITDWQEEFMRAMTYRGPYKVRIEEKEISPMVD
ncbi:MAG TPA: hypothetical protein VGO77_09525 [Mycobacterium sp.]|jgi:hypothetical protein|nr:hypothetical protein [Mycobacterium sp.]